MQFLADTTQFATTFASFDAISALIAAFFFYCLANPQRIKNRTQFWGVFVILIGIVVLYTLRLMLYNSAEGQVFVGVMIGILQVGGLILTALYVGGLTVGQMSNEIGTAVEDFRGKPKVTPIIPLSGDNPPGKYDDPVPAPRYDVEPPRYNIELPKEHTKRPSVDED